MTFASRNVNGVGVESCEKVREIEMPKRFARKSIALFGCTFASSHFVSATFRNLQLGDFMLDGVG